MSFKELVNASTMFLLRGLGLNVTDLFDYGFISAYVDDVNHDIKYNSAVFLLFKPDMILKMKDLIAKEHKRTTYLKEDYDYEGGFVVLAYEFPIKFRPDYQRFLMGEYSRFSAEYKGLFPKTVILKRADGSTEETYDMTYHVFEKSESLRKYISEKAYGERKVIIEGKQETVPLQWIDKNSELWSSPSLDGKDCLDINKIRGELVNN